MATPITIGAAAGEYMETVTVAEWMAGVGDTVQEGQTVVVVETAKAATEIGAPRAGVLTSILADAGQEIALDVILGLIGDTAADTHQDKTAHPPLSPASSSNPPVTLDPPKNHLAETLVGAGADANSGRIVASPLARRMAAERGINLAEITPSSPTGRIKLRDLDLYASTPAPAVISGLKDETGPLAVFESGPVDALPIVMLHGFASDAQSWLPLDRDLSQTHRVIRIDLPNHGRSPKRRVGNFPKLAREIVETFDALKLERAHIVGHSLGGACALALADVRARSLSSLTLISPAGLGPEVDEGFLMGIARASRPESLEPWLKRMVEDDRLITRDFVLAVMEARKEPGLRAAQIQMADDLFPDGVQGFDLTAALDRLGLPARIIWGRHDRVVPWRGALQAPGHVGLHLLRNVGHVPQLEAFDLISGILRSFITSSCA